jgi:hypothetical protein
MAKLNARTTRLLLFGICLSWLSYAPPAPAQSRGIAMTAVELPAIAPAGATYRALIIGNDDYGDGAWKPLKTAVAGARSLGELLSQQYGFTDVEVLENVNRREILIALQNLSRRVMANDSVVMYYAGHGFINMDTEQGYWVPVDAEEADHTTFIRNSTIRDELSVIASRAKHTLLISDSCFSGTLLRSDTRGITAQAPTEAYYRKVAKKKSIQILTAGGVEYVDDNYQDSGHSPFTYFLLSELAHNERPLLTASELSTQVEKAVANNVDQVPESGAFKGAGDELGEFIFINIDLFVDGVPKEKVKVQVNVNSIDDAPEPTSERSDDWRLGLGVELTAANWSGHNGGSDTDFDGGGGQLGLDIGLQKRRFYTRLGLQAGNYRFSGQAPDQVTGSETTAVRDVKIEHSEFELALGYYFWRHLSFFIDLQAVGNKWDQNDYELHYSGFGFGLAGRGPVSSRWDLFGSLALMPKTGVTAEEDSIGDVGRFSLELGTGFNPSERHRIGLGLRLATQTYEFDNGDKQEHQMVGLFLRYDFSYGF